VNIATLALLAADAGGTNIVQLILVVLGSGGLISGIIAIYKLRPDVNSAAVIQAQGTMQMMKSLVDEMRTELDSCKKDLSVKDAQLKENEALIKSLREIIQGVALWNEHDQD
jgi:threonine dehydratase